MIRTLLPAVLAFGLGLATSNLAAAEIISLPRALELAERYSPRLQSALAEVERTRSGIRTARAYPNPELELSTGRIRSRGAGSIPGSNTVLSIGQPIDLPSHRAPRIRAAESTFEGSRFALDEARLIMRTSVKSAYYEVLRRKAEYELALENQRLLEQTRNRIELSVRVGERPRFELVRIEAELASAANQANSARLRVTQALAMLKVLIGAPLPDDTDVQQETLPNYTLTDDYETLRLRMLENYPALRQAQSEIRAAEARLENERALRVPRPTLTAGIEREPTDNRGLFGISIPIPVWDQRQGPIGESVARFQQATSNAELQRIELLGDLEISFNRLLVARQQIEAFEGGLLRQAESALRVAEAAFRFGERGFIEVLDAQRVLRQVRVDYMNARFEKQAALVEIERLTAQDLVGEVRP